MKRVVMKRYGEIAQASETRTALHRVGLKKESIKTRIKEINTYKWSMR